MHMHQIDITQRVKPACSLFDIDLVPHRELVSRRVRVSCLWGVDIECMQVGGGAQQMRQTRSSLVASVGSQS